MASACSRTKIIKPLVQTERPVTGKERARKPDVLFDRDWEVFVVRKDRSTGDFTVDTACCEDALAV
ncbi:MAG: hypothetical protein ACT4O9_06185 [Blastocatellia bacterium]